MEKEFVPYELAVKLKELRFDEPCLCSWNFYTNELNFNGQPSTFSSEDVTQLPTFSQAFRWFRERYNAVCEIIRREDKNHSTFMGWVYIDIRKFEAVSYWEFKTYEASELACLEKLIEIVEQNQQ